MQETGYGYCECGCGGKTNLAPRTQHLKGWVKGEPLRFISPHQARGPKPQKRKRDRYRVESRGYQTPCHTWLLCRTGRGKDYGWERDPDTGRGRRAHILAYERTYGPVPQGLELDHLCRHSDCVNPEHLEAVTRRENMRRMHVALKADRG